VYSSVAPDGAILRIRQSDGTVQQVCPLSVKTAISVWGVNPATWLGSEAWAHVCTDRNCLLCKVSAQELPLSGLVPWMLTFGPDGALYVSTDDQYDTESTYGDPAEYLTTGSVLRVDVLPNGAFQ
jgi:hypothetical protein